MSYKPKTLKWFERRVGKRIYRDKDTCGCFSCKEVYENGLIIGDKDHANYLHMIECDFANEGHFLNYRDKK